MLCPIAKGALRLNSFSTCQLLTAVLLISLLAISGQAISSELKPFTSDGCSAFPDGTLADQALWLDCCTAHDLSYWRGGTYQQRLVADLALESCVASVGKPAIAALMLAGVRVGGSPYFPTRFRWGYGWPWPRGYGALSASELEQIQQLTP